MNKDKKGTIEEISNDKVTISISNHKLNSSKSSARIQCKVSEITFRMKPAPRNLISKKTEVLIKELGGDKYQVYLDSSIDLHIKFGRVKEIQVRQQVIIVSDYICDYEVGFVNFVSANGQKIPIDEIKKGNRLNIMIYFNADAVIEVREFDETVPLRFYLDNFTKSSTGIEETTYFCLKDQKLNIYKIFQDFMYFSSSDDRFPSDQARFKVGSNVIVTFVDGQIRAEVEIDRVTQSLRNHRRPEPAENKSKSQGNSSNLYQTEQSKGKKISVDMSTLTTPSQPTKYAYRLYDPGLQLWYLLKYSLSEKALIMASLLEVCFRHPEYKTRNTIYFKLYSVTQMLGSSYTPILDELFGFYRSEGSATQINDLFSKIYQQKVYFESVSNTLIKEFNDFETISETFDVFIYLFNSSTNNWIEFKPNFESGVSYPLIMIQVEPELKVLYSKDMMIADGFNTKSLEFSKCSKFNEENITKRFETNNKEFKNLIEEVAELKKSYASFFQGSENDFLEATKGLTQAFKMVLPLVPPDQHEHCVEAFNKLREIKLPKQFVTCSTCKNTTIAKYQCKGKDQHTFCKNCALICKRRTNCLLCGKDADFDVTNEAYTCSTCSKSYDSMYFIGLGTCFCIFDSGCAKEIIVKSVCPIHKRQLPRTEIQWIQYALNQLGYSS